jgi:LAO/AO transport system kinase
MERIVMTEPQRKLLDDFLGGSLPALARAISHVEDERPAAQALLHALHGRIGRGHRIGLTGPPGAGKSSIVTGLITAYRQRDETVGVLAVDPTSPFTGGALLGDRIRMNEVATQPGVFIRSMATRGSLGGLAVTSKEVTDLMDAFGFDRILVETVGVGQSELDIAAAADTTVVILVPESGDAVQTMKAGLMEVADLFVINKADRPGADRLAQELEVMLHMRLGEAMPAEAGHHGVSLRSLGKAARERAQQEAAAHGGWAIPVIKTVAQNGDGVDQVLATLDAHAVYLRESGELSRRRQARLAERVRGVVDRLLRLHAWGEGPGTEILARALPALESGDESPYEVGARIVRAIRLKPE